MKNLGITLGRLSLGTTTMEVEAVTPSSEDHEIHKQVVVLHFQHVSSSVGHSG